MPSSGFMRSLPETLWSPGTYLLLFGVYRARWIVIIIQRIQARGVIFLGGKIRLKYPRSLSNLTLKCWCHFGLGGDSAKIRVLFLFLFLFFPFLPFHFLSCPFQSIVSPLLLFKISVLTLSYRLESVFACICQIFFSNERSPSAL